MKPADHPPVLIAGAGPSGLVLAVVLAKAGVPFRLIEKKPGGAAPHRSVLLMSRTLELFDLLGIVEPFLEAGHKLRGAFFYRGPAQVGRLDFDRLDSPYPFALAIPHADVLELLEAALVRSGGRVERGAALLGAWLEPGGVLCKVQDAGGLNEHVEYRFVAGCDGAGGRLREYLGIESLSLSGEECYGVADVLLRGAPPADRASVYFHEKGPMALLPMEEGEQGTACAFRVIARLHGNEVGEGITPEEVQVIIQERAGEGIFLSSPSCIATFRTMRRRAARFRAGNAFLLGDAAHAHDPFGGQDLNAAIGDAVNLGWKLASVLAGDSPPCLAETYEPERIATADHLLAASARMLRLAEVGGGKASGLRDRLLETITGLPPIENALARDISQVSVHYRHGPITAERRKRFSTRGQMRAGERLPDAELILPGGGRGRLYDRVRGGGFHLFLAPETASLYGAGSYGEARFLADRIAEDFRGKLKVHWLLTPAQSVALRAELPEHIVDLGGAASHALGIEPCGAALVRPDFYSAYCSGGFDHAALRLSLLSFWT